MRQYCQLWKSRRGSYRRQQPLGRSTQPQLAIDQQGQRCSLRPPLGTGLLQAQANTSNAVISIRNSGTDSPEFFNSDFRTLLTCPSLCRTRVLSRYLNSTLIARHDGYWNNKLNWTKRPELERKTYFNAQGIGNLEAIKHVYFERSKIVSW